MGWFKKISLDFRHSPRTSDSASCTLFPGRPRATKAKIKLTSCQEKVKDKVKDMKCPYLLTSGILCYQHSSRPPPYQLPNNFWSTTVSGGMFLIRNYSPNLVLWVTWFWPNSIWRPKWQLICVKIAICCGGQLRFKIFLIDSLLEEWWREGW